MVKYLTKLRINAGYRTQVELARALGISTGHMNRIENKKVFPSVALLTRMAHILRVSTDELLLGGNIYSASGGKDERNSSVPDTVGTDRS